MRVIYFSELELQQHEERIINRALAEKDKEIYLLRAAYRQELSRCKDDIHKLIVQQATDSAAYQQLMEKAVRFAEAYHNAHLSNWIDLASGEGAEEMAAKDPVYAEARLFLKEHRSPSPEVQAWRKEQPLY